MHPRVVVLGGGHGVASVLYALRDAALELTVIVTVADDGGSSGELRRRDGGPAVGDMRRSLIALAGEDRLFARAFARPLTINRLGGHPLGNLVIRSLAKAFGDLETATDWLGEQFDISGRVLPASAEPVSLLAVTRDEVIHGESAIRTGAHAHPPASLRARAAEDTCRGTRGDRAGQPGFCWLPGSLFTSVLAATALPDVASALERTPARVLWICNLVPESRETAGMTAAEHLQALRNHGVRVDAVLYDPARGYGSPRASSTESSCRELSRRSEPTARRARSRFAAGGAAGAVRGPRADPSPAPAVPCRCRRAGAGDRRHGPRFTGQAARPRCPHDADAP